jgi:hypothetical protein
VFRPLVIQEASTTPFGLGVQETTRAKVLLEEASLGHLRTRLTNCWWIMSMLVAFLEVISLVGGLEERHPTKMAARTRTICAPRHTHQHTRRVRGHQ